jgi:hypothetical protein
VSQDFLSSDFFISNFNPPSALLTAKAVLHAASILLRYLAKTIKVFLSAVSMIPRTPRKIILKMSAVSLTPQTLFRGISDTVYISFISYTVILFTNLCLGCSKLHRLTKKDLNMNLVSVKHEFVFLLDI